MRFTCGSCGRVYVADDRIAGRAFRMRCKRCGHTIAVAPASAPPTDPAIREAGTDVARIPEAGKPEAWEADAAFGELSRELEDAGDGPADEDILEIQDLPAPGRPPAARAEPPPPIAAPAAEEPRPAPRRSKLGLVIVVGVVALAAVGGGVRYLVAPASRSAPPVAAPPAGRADAVAPGADGIPPPAAVSPPVVAPPVAPSAAPTQEERPPEPPMVPPAQASANRADGAKRAPARAPAPVPARSATPSVPQTRPEPAPAAAPIVPPRKDLPPRDLQQLQASLAGNASSFDGCVADARRDEPNLLASPRPVVLTMTVRPSGKVAYPTLDDAQLSGTALGACLKRQGAALVFPESGGEPVRVRMPLVLGP